MPKMIAPHGAHWRGRALAPGDTIDVADTDVAALVAHGFREVDDGTVLPGEQDFTGTADILSASGSLDDAGGTPAVPVESSIPVTPTSVPDIAKLSRKELLKLLRGKGAGNLFVSTEELRTLAARVLTNDSAVQTNDSNRDAGCSSAEQEAAACAANETTHADTQVPHGDE